MTDKIRAVMVGCGEISKVWLQPSVGMENLEIVGLVDLRAEAARTRAAEFGLTNALCETDLAQVLDRTRPDVVFNATIPEAHLDVTLKAFKRGCHVLGEKPMADSMDNARRMIQAARDAGKILAIIQNRRYLAGVRRMKRFLDSGALGAVSTVDCDFYLAFHPGGYREQIRHVLLLDMAIHTFDVARYLMGADVRAVYCHEWNPRGSWYAHGASAACIFEMSNGAVFNYRGSWCANGLATPWNSEWRFVGEKGTAKWTKDEEYAAREVIDAKSTQFRSLEVAPFDLTDRIGEHGGVIREFLDCMTRGGTPETVCTDNIKSLAMVFAAIESAETGQRVEVASS